MSESQDKRAVYMGTFEAYKKSNAKNMVELIDNTVKIWEFSKNHILALYLISVTALVVSIIALAI
jgi:hypothetical protein